MKLIVGISELEFENNVVIFEISTLEFVKNKVCQYKLFFFSVLFSLRIQLCMNTQQYFLE